MDLFTPIVSQELQHPHFRLIAQPGLYDPESRVLKSWADGFADRDNKFVKEFQTTFNSSFWEWQVFHGKSLPPTLIPRPLSTQLSNYRFAIIESTSEKNIQKYSTSNYLGRGLLS